MKARIFFTLSSLFTTAPFTHIAHAQPEVIPPAQQVLRACANSYQSLREFKGTSTVISQSRIGSAISEAMTLTQSADAEFDFARDTRFNIIGHDTQHRLFEIKSTPQKTTQSWQLENQAGAQEVKGIELAVASFSGVAASAPTIIPALLLSTQWGKPFNPQEIATLKGSEVFGGHRCYVVVQTQTGRHPQTKTLWIDAKTFLLRGMREEQGQFTFAVDKVAVDGMAEIPAQQAKVFFGNLMHVFAIDQTLPMENSLQEAAQKTINISQVEAAIAER